MWEISTEQEAHKHRYTRTPHSEGSYYKDSDVATCFTSAMCNRRTDTGPASHSAMSDPTSASPRWVSPHSGTRRRSLSLPPLLGDRARELTGGKGRRVINLKRQRGEERGKQKGGERNEGDGRGEREGEKASAEEWRVRRGEGAHQPPRFRPSTTAASLNLRRQKIDRAVYLCTDRWANL